MQHTDFSTTRLDARLVLKSHAALIHEGLNDPSLYTYIPEDPLSLAKLERRYAYWERRCSPDESEWWLNYTLFLKGTEQPVGTLQSGVSCESRHASIAYMILTAHQSQGFATEACRGLHQHLQQCYGVHQFRAWIDTRNEPSIRLIKRLGYTMMEKVENADHFKGSPSDEYVFQLRIARR